MTPFQASGQALLNEAVDALASAPHFTAAQKQTRSEAMVSAIMAFLPFEPVQTMLASQAVGHHFMLLDTFRETAPRSLPETLSHRVRAVSTVQTRTVLSLIKELRTVRREMQATGEAELARMNSASGNAMAGQAVRVAAGPAPDMPPKAPSNGPAAAARQPPVTAAPAAASPPPSPAEPRAKPLPVMPGTGPVAVSAAAQIPMPAVNGSQRAAGATAVSPLPPTSSPVVPAPRGSTGGAKPERIMAHRAEFRTAGDVPFDKVPGTIGKQVANRDDIPGNAPDPAQPGSGDHRVFPTGSMPGATAGAPVLRDGHPRP